MTQEKLIDAITDLDSDILNRYFDMKADLAAKKKPKKPSPTNLFKTDAVQISVRRFFADFRQKAESL